MPTPPRQPGRTRTSRRHLPALVAGLAALLSSVQAAAEARLFIHPTLVMFSGTQRSETVHIVNQGDATGVVELAWVDFAMTPEGGLSAREGGAPWSLQPFVRYSPRRVTLKPGETQVVRIALRSSGDAAEVEYYSHLRVLTLEDDLQRATARPKTKATASLSVEARTAIAIPVVWRNSDAAPRAAITSARPVPGTNELVVEVHRTGALSTRGYLHVLGAAGGIPEPLSEPVPLVIYPSIDVRKIPVRLTKPIEDARMAGAQIIYSPDAELTSTSSHFASYQIAR